MLCQKLPSTFSYFQSPALPISRSSWTQWSHSAAFCFTLKWLLNVKQMCSCWIEQNTNRGCRGEYVYSVINIPSTTLGKARTTENHFASLGKMEGNWSSAALWDWGAFPPCFLCTSSLFQIAPCLSFEFPALSITGCSLSFWDSISGSPGCHQIHHPRVDIASRENEPLTQDSWSCSSAAGRLAADHMGAVEGLCLRRVLSSAEACRRARSHLTLSPAFWGRPALSQVTACSVCPVAIQPSPMELLSSTWEGEKKSSFKCTFLPSISDMPLKDNANVTVATSLSCAASELLSEVPRAGGIGLYCTGDCKAQAYIWGWSFTPTWARV